MKSIIYINKNELELVREEGYLVDVQDTIEYGIYRINVDMEQENDLIICLNYIREHTKGYGNTHTLELYGRKEIGEKIISFKELIRLHNYSQLKELNFACESNGDNKYTIYFDGKDNNLIDFLIG